ncbi:MAG: ferrous iron transporter B [Clostridiales bacterium]|jgi:ferrous iron transport protein B|nr:ferrous iron transporter B [Clostridiales bacterium]
MAIKIALAGNPNSGKTTLFNALTGSNQFVGNWPGVTVEKKEGRLKNRKDVIITDLPGIYSMSPYTLEEVVARDYLTDNQPDAIINIVDGANIERNLFLTLQLVEMGVPVVVAINMIDEVQKAGDKIDAKKLSDELGCPVAEISALKGAGIADLEKIAVEAAVQSSGKAKAQVFSDSVEQAIADITKRIDQVKNKRWHAVKLFERDEKIAKKLQLSEETISIIDKRIGLCEKKLDDDSESLIASERYQRVDALVKKCVAIKNKDRLSVSDKIDRIVTNRLLALPIFIAVMFIVYCVSVTTVGAFVTDWANDGVFGDGWRLFGSPAYDEAVEEFDKGLTETKPDPSEYGVWIPGVPVLVENFLDFATCDDWLKSLILDGIVAGVGAVLGFTPQMFILFTFLAFLESCGYMARIAFIMDRIFRRFGLSGKSFIPILIGSGCGVPGIMSSRTIENDRDRKITIITTTFMPCGAKLPMIALVSGAFFKDAWWVAPSAYFLGAAAIICSGVILKKTPIFAGAAAPFVMELPAYRMPSASGLFHSVWERASSFVKRAGTIILLASVLIWITSTYGWDSDGLGAVHIQDSFLARAGSSIAWLFTPLGWGDWKFAVGTISGLVAKENLVGTLGVLMGAAEGSSALNQAIAMSLTGLAAYSALTFNLLCAPCFAAIGAIKREMNNAKWLFAALAYQCGLAYAVSLCIYQIGILVTTGAFGIGTIAAAMIIAAFLFMLFRPAEEKTAALELN